MKKLEYAGKTITISPYTTIDERDMLLYASLDIEGIFELVKHLVKPNDGLTKTEKKYILLELRMMSVSEQFTLRTGCNSCEKRFEFDINFNDSMKNNKIIDFKGIKLVDALSETLQDYAPDINVDDLEVSEYDELAKHIKEHSVNFNFVSNTICPYCKSVNHIELSDKLLIENLSEDTITNFYQVISSMIFFGNYSKLDIDSMLPFERSIYVSLLNEQLKKKKEAANG